MKHAHACAISKKCTGLRESLADCQGELQTTDWQTSDNHTGFLSVGAKQKTICKSTGGRRWPDLTLSKILDGVLPDDASKVLQGRYAPDLQVDQGRTHKLQPLQLLVASDHVHGLLLVLQSQPQKGITHALPNHL